MPAILDTMTISIHAPLRERPLTSTDVKVVSSTLPYGSDYEAPACPFDTDDFNPRSLTGATRSCCFDSCPLPISIHAPSRERQGVTEGIPVDVVFQSTLPHGSDWRLRGVEIISVLFQSTLPHGSDITVLTAGKNNGDFNPRSLTGATFQVPSMHSSAAISIHAPSRE